MDFNLDHIRAIQGASSLTSEAQVKIEEAKRRLSCDLKRSIHYIADAKKNGIVQGLVVTNDTVPYKARVDCLPGDTMYVGDEVVCLGQHWIVTEVKCADAIHFRGVMWLCNYECKFQNFSKTVLSQWGVLDSGVYSTTIAGGAAMPYPDKQFKLYLPYTPDTAKLFIDKRLATGTIYDPRGKEILEVYQITGSDKNSHSYQSGGHLLVLNLRSNAYVEKTDRMDLCVCDYISVNPDEPHIDDTAKPPCTLSGQSTIRLGRSRTYSVLFGTDQTVIAKWSVLPVTSGISYVASGNQLTLSVLDSESLIGTVLTIAVSDASGVYATASIHVEVVENV